MFHKKLLDISHTIFHSEYLVLQRYACLQYKYYVDFKSKRKYRFYVKENNFKLFIKKRIYNLYTQVAKTYKKNANNDLNNK